MYMDMYAGVCVRVNRYKAKYAAASKVSVTAKLLHGTTASMAMDVKFTGSVVRAVQEQTNVSRGG